MPLRKVTSSSLPDHHDRESNEVLFGLAECASLVGTRERVDEVLEYLTGSKLAIKDLFGWVVTRRGQRWQKVLLLLLSSSQIGTMSYTSLKSTFAIQSPAGLLGHVCIPS